MGSGDTGFDHRFGQSTQTLEELSAPVNLVLKPLESR
jgi:hypothetical protein